MTLSRKIANDRLAMLPKHGTAKKIPLETKHASKQDQPSL